jgi:hypothetical protein
LLRPDGGDCTQEEVRESEHRSLKRNEGSETQERQKEEREREREREREGRKKGRQYFLTLASSASSYFLFSFPPKNFFFPRTKYTFCVKT